MIDTTNIATRPFDMNLARRGAPYATRAGKKATILKWDCNHDLFVLAGVFGEHDEPKRWRADGGFGHSRGSFGEDLVMTPLGEVEGRPFFCGDKIVGSTGTVFNAEPRDQDGSHADWYWPAAPSLLSWTTGSIESAFATLENLGYTYCGGALWRPPLGLTPGQKSQRQARDQKIASAVFEAMYGVVEVPDDSAANVVKFRVHTRAQIDAMLASAIAQVPL
jgi:hypothetical protein